jgi:hypothetical protein
MGVISVQRAGRWGRAGKNTFDELECFQGEKLHARRTFSFDHVSLEEDRRTWHLTAPSSSDHVAGPRTLDLGEGRVLWFGLSFQTFEAFRPVLNETTLEFVSPRSDSQRRREAFTAAREGALFPIIALNGEHPNPFHESFVHVSVVAGPPGFQDYMGPELAFPVGSPYLRAPLPVTLSNLPCRTHRVALSTTTDIQITVTQLPGALVTPVTFTGPTSHQHAMLTT